MRGAYLEARFHSLLLYLEDNVGRLCDLVVIYGSGLLSRMYIESICFSLRLIILFDGWMFVQDFHLHVSLDVPDLPQSLLSKPIFLH